MAGGYAHAQQIHPLATHALGCRGLSVEDDGSVYYSGVPQVATPPTTNDAANFRANHFVAKVR
jgi:hypothetical protein